MKPTKIWTLSLMASAITVVAFFTSRILVSNGMAIPVSPTNLIITLSGIGGLVLMLAIPIWKYKNALKQTSNKQRPKRVDPFYAVRVLLLAKASAIAGAVFLGWHLGVLIALATLPVSAATVVIQNTVALIASALLSVCSYIAEQICKLPEDKDPEASDQAVST
jgi:hypothetical protein